MNTYRLRAECATDVFHLVQTLPAGQFLALAVLRQPGFPDVEVRLVVQDMDLERLRAACRNVVDGHVMLQTVQPPNCYNGERDYSIE